MRPPLLQYSVDVRSIKQRGPALVSGVVIVAGSSTAVAVWLTTCRDPQLEELFGYKCSCKPLGANIAAQQLFKMCVMAKGKPHSNCLLQAQAADTEAK